MQFPWIDNGYRKDNRVIVLNMLKLSARLNKFSIFEQN